jgi:hypothetical protein
VQVWALAAQPPPAASGTPAAATAAQCTQQELQDELSTRLNAAAMLWLKAALVLLLAAAVAISGSLSYTLGAHAHAFGARAAESDELFFSLRCLSVCAGHNAELQSLWRAFDAAGGSMQNNFQDVLTFHDTRLRRRGRRRASWGAHGRACQVQAQLLARAWWWSWFAAWSPRLSSSRA